MPRWSPRDASEDDGRPADRGVRSPGEDGRSLGEDGRSFDWIWRAIRRIDPAVAVAALCVVGAVGGLFLHHPGPAEPADVPFGTDEAVLADGAHRYTGQLTAVRGDDRFHFEATRTYVPGGDDGDGDGEADPAVAAGRLTFDDSEGRTTYATYQRGTVAYTRQTWSNATEFRDALERRPDDDVVRVEASRRAVYDVDRDREPPEADERPGLALAALAQFRYERAGTATVDGREVVRYEAVPGWVRRPSGVGGGESFVHLARSAEGEVLVDPGTGTVVFADVEGTIVGADTWGGAMVSEPVHVSITYRLEPDVPAPTEPAWVDGLEDAGRTSEGAGDAGGAG